MYNLHETALHFLDGARGPPSPPNDTTPSPLSPRSSLYLELFGGDWDKISVSSAQSDAGGDARMMDAREVDDDFLYLDSDHGSKAVDCVSIGEGMRDDEEEKLQSGQTTLSLHSDTKSRAASPDLVLEDEEPPPRPSSPYLTEEEIHLPLGLISEADYDLFMTSRPVEPSWNPEIPEKKLRLFNGCAIEADFSEWTSTHDELWYKFDSYGASKRVLRKKPDGDFIRNNYQLGRAKGLPYLDDDLQTHLLNILDTVRWVYDDETMEIEADHYLLKYAPLPLQYLIRGFAHAVELREGVMAACDTLTKFLQSRVHRTRRQSAAIVLLDGLSQRRTPDRRALYFSRPDGSPRIDVDGKEPWAWFFDAAERGYSYDALWLDN
ncbi:hypothetical protein JCM10296v2_005507 [Rhodotorula toruloides]